MGLEGVNMPRLGGAVAGFVFMFIASCLLWNVFSDDLEPATDDGKAAVNYYIFTLWVLGAVCIFAVLKYASTAVHNALVLIAFGIFTQLFTGFSSPSGSITTAFASVNAVRDQLESNETDVLKKLMAAGILAMIGMLLSLLSASMRMNITDSGKMIKLATLGVVVLTTFIGVIIFWAADDINDPIANIGNYTYTAGVLIVTFATIIAVLGTHQGVAGFLLVYGGFVSLYALSNGLLISSGFTGDDRDTARAGMVMCFIGSITSIVPAFLVYQDESASE